MACYKARGFLQKAESLGLTAFGLGEKCEMRRILFRLWLVATFLWACLIFFVAYDDKRLSLPLLFL